MVFVSQAYCNGPFVSKKNAKITLCVNLLLSKSQARDLIWMHCRKETTMSVSKFLLVIAAASVTVLSACAGPGTYPITGDPVSANDPVQDMNPANIFRGESR
jgi:hypothetical protein